jgi:hypothetical protein
MSAATHDLYELATTYAKARAVHSTKPSEYYVWMETSFNVRMLKTNRICGQHVRFQERSTEYPIPVSKAELDSCARGYLEVRHSDSTVLVGYSPNTSIWCIGEKLRNHIRKLWPKYVITEDFSR